MTTRRPRLTRREMRARAAARTCIALGAAFALMFAVAALAICADLPALRGTGTAAAVGSFAIVLVGFAGLVGMLATTLAITLDGGR